MSITSQTGYGPIGEAEAEVIAEVAASEHRTSSVEALRTFARRSPVLTAADLDGMTIEFTG